LLYREIIAVCSQIHTKLCGQNVELLNVKLVVHIVTTEGLEGYILRQDGKLWSGFKCEMCFLEMEVRIPQTECDGHLFFPPFLGQYTKCNVNYMQRIDEQTFKEKRSIIMKVYVSVTSKIHIRSA
jgi:hypothetical protein